KPRWNLSMHSFRDRWDRNRGKWADKGRWRFEGYVEVAFQEPFQALRQGDDFFFLTRSGRLFVAPKPARGTNRTIRAVWDDPRRRVLTFLTDADSGRTFLFCKAARGGKPAWFELSARPRPVAYDPPELKGAPKDPALRQAFACARVLLAAGKVKAPP